MLAAELGERRLEQLLGLVLGVIGHQVDGHVVTRIETRPQRLGSRGRDPGNPFERHPAVVKHHRRAPMVDAATAGATGQLGEFAAGERLVGLSVELREALEHDRSSRHVDAEGKGLGGEDDLYEPADEELLHGFLEDRDHAGVVRRHPAAEPVRERLEPERRQIGSLDVGDSGLQMGVDLGAFPGGREAQTGRGDGISRPLTAGPREDEVDRGQ